MKNLLITMSGGTTSVINATLAGLISEARNSKEIGKIYAGSPGIVGFMSGGIIDLTNITETELGILKFSPGSASIGTTRTKIFDTESLDCLSGCFKKHNIGYFVNIGGNGTIKQTKLIASHIKNIHVAAAPKTVDNDLGDAAFEELWYTPGFPSCVNYWYHTMKMLDNENRGASTHDKVLIAQTFGRETGFIVGAMRFFDIERKLPLILLLPEDHQTPEKILDKIDNNLNKFDRTLIGICEGYNIKEYNYNYDLSGQRMYGSSASTAIQQLINLCNNNDFQARGHNPTVGQRQNFNYTLDGDIDVSYKIGVEIIKNFRKNKTHFFQSYSKKCFNIIPLETITNYSRKMKKEWIDFGNFDVTNKYIDYLEGFVTPTEAKKRFIFGEIV
jgi:6-phosphofructokinase 1